MAKSKLAKKLLLSAMIVEGVYVLALIALTLLQETIKVKQNAPIAARGLFYFPVGSVVLGVVALGLMGVLAALMLPRLAVNAKQGRLPIVATAFFGVAVPVLSVVEAKLQYAWYASEKTSSMEFMIGAECLNGALAWVAPLLLIGSALFVAGSAIAYCAKSE